MSVSLTKRQAEAYRFVSDFIRERGYSPSVEEIAIAMGDINKSSAHRHIDCLVERGYLRRRWRGRRHLEVVDGPRGRLIAHNLRLSDFPIEPAVEAMASIDALQNQRAA